jgi:hypothetical protein
MSEAGSDVRENYLLTRKNPQPRFTVKQHHPVCTPWVVYDELLQIEVFHWFGTSGEAKSNAVAKALNDLGHEKD